MKTYFRKRKHKGYSTQKKKRKEKDKGHNPEEQTKRSK